MKREIPKILVVDDEKNIVLFLSEILEDEGYIVDSAEDGGTALEKVFKNNYSIVLLDLKMPRMDGITFMKKLYKSDVDVAVIVLTGHGTIQDALLCTKLGAYDFLEKPIDVDKILLILKNCLKEKRLILENRILKGEEQKPVFYSKPMKAIKRIINDNAYSNAPVYINAPLNSDKISLARYIHQVSKRKECPFIFFDCSFAPRELLQKSLFGYSSESGKYIFEGKFQQAHTGTLFLDNIEHCPFDIQKGILSYLSMGTVLRDNDTVGEVLDLRLIFASGENLSLLVEEKKFDPRFLFAIDVVRLDIPPLGTRKEDIPVLFQQFLNMLSQRDNLSEKAIEEDVFKLLKSYPWPGDVEELKSFANKVYSLLFQLERVTLKDIESIWLNHKGVKDKTLTRQKKFKSLKLAKWELEREYIQKVLEFCNWDVPKSANILNIERTYLYSKIKRLKIHR